MEKIDPKIESPSLSILIPTWEPGLTLFVEFNRIHGVELLNVTAKIIINDRKYKRAVERSAPKTELPAENSDLRNGIVSAQLSALSIRLHRAIR